jgi:hypothetical protein
LVDLRDDFSRTTKELLAKRVGYRCSNPSCCQLTSGPHEDVTKTVNVGVAAHLTAASPGGPRYKPSLSAKQRKSPDNGIWLCQKCAKLVDNDSTRYTVNVLHEWKQIAEEKAIREIEGNAASPGNSNNLFDKRVEACQSLFYAVKKASSIIEELFETEELSVEIKQKIAFEVCLEIAELTDNQGFYLDHEVVVHTLGSFVGVEDIFAIDEPEARQTEIDTFRKYIRNAYRMIESVRDTGKLNRSIKSPLVEYYTHLREIQDKDDQEY